MPHTHVISISTATTRREHINREFTQHNVPFAFFDAITPGKTLDTAIQQHLPPLANAPMTDGEKACFMSHWLLWQHCLDHHWPHITVFEDDIILGQHADAFLNDTTWLNNRFPPNSAFIVRLETVLMNVYAHPDPHIPPHHQRRFDRLKSVHWGMGAYVISTAAIKRLQHDFLSCPQTLQTIDIMVFNRYFDDNTITIRQLNPAVCIQDSILNPQITLHSQLETERQRHQHMLKTLRHHSQQRTPQQWLCHALGKPKRMWRKLRSRPIPFA